MAHFDFKILKKLMGLMYEQMPHHSQTTTYYFIGTMIVWADIDWVQILHWEAGRQLLKMQEKILTKKCG